MFQPSPFQSAFFSALQESQSSILLEAVAGSGKTTTIVQSASLLSPHLLTKFLAFNKRIAEELEAKLPAFVQVGTFHSQSYAALRRGLPKSPRVDKDKVRNILKSNVKWDDFQMYSQFVTKLVSLAKSAGLGTELVSASNEEWQGLISHFALTLDNPDADISRGIDLASKVLEESNSSLSLVDFDDMLYLALLRKVNFDKCNFIFVDEAQDTNGVQRALLKLMMGPNSRLIAVGDKFQSIYGFRGADASAMDLIASDFSCIRLPLSISYRCSKAVVNEAQKYLN